jgi:glycosyltransferase involved in cell wall biosynthesis
MLITVVVVTHNRASFLPVAIRSLMRQRSDAALDVLVVDDGSTDATPETMAALSAEFPGLRHVRQDHAGISAARNTGLQALLPETEVVTFLDSDDSSPAGRFAADLPLLLADPACDLTYGRLRMVETIDPATLDPPPGASYRDACLPQLSLGLFRRRIIEQTGLFDLGLEQSEDLDFLLRMFESGAPFLQTQTIALYYRRHPGNITARRAHMQRFMSLALLRSTKRRRADPSRIMRKPEFDLPPPVMPGDEP